MPLSRGAQLHVLELLVWLLHYIGPDLYKYTVCERVFGIFLAKIIVFTVRPWIHPPP